MRVFHNSLNVAGDRPPRYGKKTPPLHRRARACPSPCCDRGLDRQVRRRRGSVPPVPRHAAIAGETLSDARMASEGPRATGKKTVPFTVAGAPDSDPFGLRRARTTEVGPIRSGRRALPVSIFRIGTGMSRLRKEMRIGTRMSRLPKKIRRKR